MRTFPISSKRAAAEMEVVKVQEQANEKTVGLVCRSSRMTARTFFRLLDKYLRHEEMKSRNKQIDKRYNESQHRNDPKKVKVKDLVKDGSGVSTIEIKDEKIRQFEKLARHNGVRYAIKKDKSTMPPTYIVFFRAKDAEMIQRTMKEFLKKNVKGPEKAAEKAVEPIIHSKLAKFTELAKECAEKISKIRNKDLER